MDSGKYNSTNHAIITLVERISKALDTGKIIVGVFLDLRKAFDTVNHDKLLDKLYTIEIHSNIHKWYRSYLTDRSQYVVSDNNKSDSK